MPKKEEIRGVPVKKYLEYMRKIEQGKTTDEKLVRAGKLKPTARGIKPSKRQKALIFSNRNKTRGKGKDGECRVPDCNNTATRRGLCNTCRVEARRMIKLGKATEQNLLNRGLILSKSSGGSRIPSKTKQSKKKKVKRRGTGKVTDGFPSKLLNASACLYKGCKTTRKGGARGLCSKHYSQYKRKREKLSSKKRIQLEKDLIRRRLLLPRTGKAKSVKRKRSLPESSAFEIGATMRGSVHRY